MEYDLKHETDNHKMLFDEFFIIYMTDKFKMKKIINRNCEDAILAFIKYSNEDKRVDLARRFLGIGEDKLRQELLDLFFILIKSNFNFFYK